MVRALWLTAIAAAAVTMGVAASAPREAQQAAQTPDAALLARGDSVFRGRLGGSLCWTCHGANAKGMPNMGPDLTDTVWLNVDGSVEQIKTLIRTGVARPKRATVPMPPWGGAPLDSARLEAVAVYVANLNRSSR
jgi:mono/diheme cytochrome c family protein